VVLKLDLKPKAMRPMILPLSKYAADMRRERNETEQMLAEQSFSIFRIAMGENAACRSQPQGSVLQFGKFQDVKCLGDRKEIVDFQRERARRGR
jgi:hypothetical protein